MVEINFNFHMQSKIVIEQSVGSLPNFLGSHLGLEAEINISPLFLFLSFQYELLFD